MAQSTTTLKLTPAEFRTIGRALRIAYMAMLKMQHGEVEADALLNYTMTRREAGLLRLAIAKVHNAGDFGETLD